MAIPGLEDYPVLEAAMSSHDSNDALDATADADVKQYCKLEIRNCLSKKTTLKHSQGTSFIDINKLMSASWKVLGDFYQSVFEELSEEENRKRAADDSFLSPPSTPKKMKRSDSSTSSSSKKTVHFSPDIEAAATPPIPVIHQPVYPVSPTSVCTASLVGNYVDSVADISIMSDISSEYSFDEFPALPFLEKEEKKEEVTADDFLLLVATLDDL